VATGLYPVPAARLSRPAPGARLEGQPAARTLGGADAPGQCRDGGSASVCAIYL